MAVIMKYLGPKNPFYVVVVVFATIASVYAVLFATGTSLEEARDQGWFWHHEEIVYEKMSANVSEIVISVVENRKFSLTLQTDRFHRMATTGSVRNDKRNDSGKDTLAFSRQRTSACLCSKFPLPYPMCFAFCSIDKEPPKPWQGSESGERKQT